MVTAACDASGDGTRDCSHDWGTVIVADTMLDPVVEMVEPGCNLSGSYRIA